jgi:hypothetical protein
MAFKMKAGKEGPMKKNFGIGKNLPDGRSTSSAFQKEMPTDFKNLTKTNYKEDTKKKSGPDWSKAPKLNTQARRDWYTKNNLAQDATTKLKPAEKATATPTVKPAAETTTNVKSNFKSNLKPPTKLPTIKPKLTATAGNLLGTISASIKPKAKDETKVKLKKNKLTGKTKVKTVEKIGDKVIKTKTITDRKGNVKTKTKERKRRAGKGKQKIAKALTKFASKLLR